MKRKKIGICVLIGGLLIVAMIVGIRNKEIIENWFRMHTASAESYYAYVERKNNMETLSYFEKIYSETYRRLTEENQTRKINCRLEWNDVVKTFLTKGKIGSVSLCSEGVRDGSAVARKVTLQVDDKEAFHARQYIDYKHQEELMQFPEISDQYLGRGENLRNGSSQTDAYLFDMLSDAGQYLPAFKEIQKSLKKYSADMADQKKSVKRSARTLQAGNVKKRYVCLEVKYQGSEAAGLMQTVLQDLTKNADTLMEQTEKNVKKSLPEVDRKSWEEDRYIRDKYASVSAMRKRVQKTLQEVKRLADQTKDQQITMQIYVDQRGRAVGRTLSFILDGRNYCMTYAVPVNGNKFGLEIAFKIGDAFDLQIAGSGTCQNGTISGNFSFSLPEAWNPCPQNISSMQDILQIKVQKLEQKKLLTDGVLQADVTFSTGQIPRWKNYALQMKLLWEKERIKSDAVIKVGKDRLVTAELVAEKLSKAEKKDVDAWKKEAQKVLAQKDPSIKRYQLDQAEDIARYLQEYVKKVYYGK